MRESYTRVIGLIACARVNGRVIGRADGERARLALSRAARARAACSCILGVAPSD